VQEIFLFSSALKVKILSKKLEELEALLSKLKEWCKILREVFSSILFICGPKNNKKTMQIHVLLHFFCQAKMAIWLSRKGKLSGVGSTDP